MSSENEPNLIIPEGLHYECTGCGKCCSGWSVPMTEEDYQRISAIDWGSLDPSLKDKKLFRPLTAQQKTNTPYTHAINATPEGQCPFLKNNLCFIHSQFDAKTKPSMCQLFPYSFNETPSGIYTSVSFVSRGAIFNAGKLLTDQREYLLSKYKDFKSLFVNYLPNWSQIKLSTNIPLSWNEYLNIEARLLSFLQDKSQSLEERFIEGCEYLDSLLTKQTPSPVKADHAVGADVIRPLNRWDKIVLVWLYKTYFPGQGNRPQGYGNLTFDIPGIFVETIRSFFDEQTNAQPNESKTGPYYDSGGFSYNFASELLTLPWPDTDEEINDIFYRFFYSHIFGKHYFGAGLGQLSLITGFHHLAILLALIKLHARKLAAAHFSSEVSKMDIEQTIVQLEKSFGELKITASGAAILETLLASPARIARILRFTR